MTEVFNVDKKLRVVSLI